MEFDFANFLTNKDKININAVLLCSNGWYMDY